LKSNETLGEPEGSSLQFVVLVVKICGSIYWQKNRVPYLALVLPRC